eukprot:symbB.v1.2.014553.t1/scaffold1051.1/size143026/3
MLVFPIVCVLVSLAASPVCASLQPPVCVILGQSRRFVRRWLFDNAETVGDEKITETLPCIGVGAEVKSILVPKFGHQAMNGVNDLATAIRSAHRVTRFVLSLSTNPRSPQVKRDLLVLRTLVGPQIWEHLDVFHPFVGREANEKYRKDRVEKLQKLFQKLENGFKESSKVPLPRHYWTGIRKSPDMLQHFLEGNSTVHERCRRDRDERCQGLLDFCAALHRSKDFEPRPRNYLQNCVSSKPPEEKVLKDEQDLAAQNLTICLRHGGQHGITSLGWGGLTQLKKEYADKKNMKASTAVAFIIFNSGESGGAGESESFLRSLPKLNTFFPDEVTRRVQGYSSFDSWEVCEASKDTEERGAQDLGRDLLRCIPGIQSDDALIGLQEHWRSRVNSRRQVAVVNSVDEAEQAELISKLGLRLVFGRMECFLELRLVAAFSMILHRESSMAELISKTEGMDEIRRITGGNSPLNFSLEYAGTDGADSGINSNSSLQFRVTKFMDKPVWPRTPMFIRMTIHGSECIDQGLKHWCSDHGTCMEGRCMCAPGYTGLNCEEEEVCYCPDKHEVRGPPCTRQDSTIVKGSYLWFKLCADGDGDSII